MIFARTDNPGVQIMHYSLVGADSKPCRYWFALACWVLIRNFSLWALSRPHVRHTHSWSKDPNVVVVRTSRLLMQSRRTAVGSFLWHFNLRRAQISGPTTSKIWFSISENNRIDHPELTCVWEIVQLHDRNEGDGLIIFCSGHGFGCAFSSLATKRCAEFHPRVPMMNHSVWTY